MTQSMTQSPWSVTQSLYDSVDDSVSVVDDSVPRRHSAPLAEYADGGGGAGAYDALCRRAHARLKHVPLSRRVGTLRMLHDVVRQLGAPI